MTDFEKLLDDLGVVAKSMSAEKDAMNDKKIAAAAGDENDNGIDDEDEDDEYADGDDEKVDPKMVKSITMDGKNVDVIDGTVLMKSLMDRLDSTETKTIEALNAAVGVIATQGEMIKSLQGQFAKISTEGRGRKAVLSVSEKTSTMAKSLPADEGKMNGTEFMAKAMDAQRAGRINGQDVAVAEGCLNRGMPVPQHIISRVGA